MTFHSKHIGLFYHKFIFFVKPSKRIAFFSKEDFSKPGQQIRKPPKNKNLQETLLPALCCLPDRPSLRDRESLFDLIHRFLIVYL